MENLNDKMISFCIPNFNYAVYMDSTLASLSIQSDLGFEITISDNCSTDNSMDVIKKWAPKFSQYNYIQNKANVGFGGNLDKVAELATNKFMVMLSSDDIVETETVSVYKKFINLVENKNPMEKFFFGGQPTMIDSNSTFIKRLTKNNELWDEKYLDYELSRKMGFNVYKVASNEMLGKCLTSFKTPLHFITVCYPSASYKEVEGYGGSRMYNPDKWFNWKLLDVTDYIYFLDKPLFQYRWHNNNQANQQQQNQILKYWMDDYRNSFEVTELMLKKANLNVQQVKKNFIRKCILSSVVRFAKNGDKKMASRILNFGKACYPEHCKTLMFKSVKLISHSQTLSKILFR
jgi:glycosyltransferase involved in cell wall biosynthesis